MKNNTIRVYIDYNERKKIRYYKDFEIVSTDEMKGLANDFDINEILHIDPEQGNDKVYDYEYYFYDYKDGDETYTRYLALPIFDYEHWLYERIGENSCWLNQNWKFIDWGEEMQNLEGMEEMHGLDGEEEMQNMEEMQGLEGEEMNNMEGMEHMEEMKGLDEERM